MSDREDRAGDIERGLALIPRLGEVMPEDADEETRAVYEAVQTHLRVPFVNFIFRMLGNYPRYLSYAWGELAPQLLTPDFEGTANDLRRRALLEPVPDAADVAWEALGDLDQIRGFTDTIHYVLPKLLLVVSALDEGLGGERGTSGRTPEPAVAPGVAEGATSVRMVAPDEADERLARLYEEIQERHGHPGVASYYRGIARWPRFLEAAWERIGPLVRTDPYEERKRDLLERARDAVLGMALPDRRGAIERGLTEEGAAEIRAVLAVFRFRVIPDTFVEVPLVKAMLDGPEAARSSRFSFTDR